MNIDRYAVMGNPIKHSKSPQIHRAFAMQTDQDLTYTSQLVPEDGLAQAIREFFSDPSAKGLNITVPFKEQVIDSLQGLSERAQRAKAVNTIIRRESGELMGENTDGVGLVRDILHNHDGRLADKKILVLGAGGAVRGVLGPLLAENPAQVIIANRTFEKAEQLAREFQDLGPISACPLSHLNEPFNWVINGTAASLGGELPAVSSAIFDTNTWVYDLMYGKEATPFNAWALAQGVNQAIDGLGMLVEQAAESFRLWRGVTPATAPVIAELRSGN